MRYCSEPLFYSEYEKAPDHIYLDISVEMHMDELIISAHRQSITIRVERCDTKCVDKIFTIFDKNVDKSRILINDSSMKISKLKNYKNMRFSADVIKEAEKEFINNVKNVERCEKRLTLNISNSDETWKYDNEEVFFSDLRKSHEYAYFRLSFYGGYIFSIEMDNNNVKIGVDLCSRREIESVFEVFEKNIENSRLPEPEKENPVVFIGHGRNSQWNDLKNHLQDMHRIKVEAYEIGARAGHAIRDILEDMMEKSTIAFLVMTGEDTTEEGGLRARQNVIHEIGLFQGKLGFTKGIVLLEDGCDAFSNIEGIQQIRFSKNNIKETFGDVIATINREFQNYE